MSKPKGFTLLEILIALFIFSIISLIVVTALHTTLNIQTATEKNTSRFNQLHMALLLTSRDFEQIVNRQVINAKGTPETAVVGNNNEIRFTHAGFANPTGNLNRSSLQRVHYFLRRNKLIRETWPQLDITKNTPAHQRELLDNVTLLSFEYLDTNNKFKHNWPSSGQTNQPLPLAIRISITLADKGKISQLYVISH